MSPTTLRNRGRFGLDSCRSAIFWLYIFRSASFGFGPNQPRQRPEIETASFETRIIYMQKGLRQFLVNSARFWLEPAKPNQNKKVSEMPEAK